MVFAQEHRKRMILLGKYGMANGNQHRDRGVVQITLGDPVAEQVTSLGFNPLTRV